jgi:hypothetical protein
MARYFPNNGAPGAPVHFPPGGRFEAKRGQESGGGPPR